MLKIVCIYQAHVDFACAKLSAVLQDVSLQALTVVLQHPATAANQRDICTWLQVCRAWRVVVQQSAAIDVILAGVRFGKLDASLRQLTRVSSFAGWLVKHPAMIRTLSIIFDNTSEIYSASKPVLEAAKQVALDGVQAAACGACAQLRVLFFGSTLPPSAALLAALPAATLTQLILFKVSNSNWCCTLNQLSSLRSVFICMGGTTTETTDSCLLQLGGLRQLTSLDLTHLPVGGDMRLLPTQLQELSVNYRKPDPPGEDLLQIQNGSEASTMVDLQHLLSLRTLFVGADQLEVGSSVPPNLQEFNMAAKWPAVGLIGVTDLQQVTSIMISEGAAHLSALRNLPQLKSLSLYVYPYDDALEATAACRGLPLSALNIQAEVLSTGELQLLMQHVASATKLTKLTINAQGLQLEPDIFDIEPPRIVVCQHLKALKNIRSLGLHMFPPFVFEEQDAQHLTALDTLTNLKLGGAYTGPYLDSATVRLLAKSLTNLTVLAINDTKMCTIPGPPLADLDTFAIPAVGRLTSLEALKLGTLAADDAQRGLLHLTGLTRLTKLVGFDKASKTALRDFWASIKSHAS